jgi:hypothetical protein
MSMIESKRGHVLYEDEDHAIENIYISHSFDGNGPTVGVQFLPNDGSGKVTVMLPTAEAFKLALELLGYVQLSEEKHGHWLDKPR